MSELILEPTLPTKTEILPNCIAQRSEKTVVWANGMKWIPIFCANCGCDGGQVLETDWERVNNWAFYLCEACAEKWSPLVDHALAPDELFWKKVREAQIEAFGRELTDIEIIEALKDDSHVLSTLAKDRHQFKKLA
jgi:hypothetical protein